MARWQRFHWIPDKIIISVAFSVSGRGARNKNYADPALPELSRVCLKNTNIIKISKWAPQESPDLSEPENFMSWKIRIFLGK